MASRDRDDEEGFLSRWSQRKRAAEAEAPKDDQALPGEGAVAGAQLAAVDPAGREGAKGEGAGGEGAEGEGGGTIDPAELPDIDSLNADSDFTPFLKEGVPDALRRRALRKLWRLDPVFGHLDGLNDYDLDYTNAATVVEGMKTIYQVGKGMVLGDEEEGEEAAKEDGGEGQEAEAASGEALAEPSPESSQEEAARLEAPAEEALPPAGQAPASKTKTRNPGDPLVSAAPTRRSSVSRAPQRSALQRRWGDPER